MEVFEEIKDSFKDKNLTRVFFPILIMVLSIYELNNDYLIFHNLIEFFCVSLGMAITLVSFTKNYKSYNVFNYIGFGFLLLCFVNIAHLVLINYSTNGESDYIATVYVWMSNNYLEYMVVVLALIFIKIKPRFKTMLLSYLGAGSLVVIYGVITLYFQGTKEQYLVIADKIWWHLLIIFILALYLIYKNRYFIDKKGITKLYLYLSYIFLYEATAKLHFSYNFETLVIAHSLKYIAYYSLFKTLNEHILYETYDSMYKNLLEVEERQKQLNETLNYRLNILTEVKGILSKSERRYVSLLESISDGIMIFHYNSISYANKSSAYFIRESLEDITGMNLYEVLEKLELEPDEFINEGFVETSIRLNINGEIKFLDICLFESEDNTKILFVKDVTEKNRNYNLKSDLQKYLKEENLKKEFFSNISHELRTPINLIYSSLQVKELYMQDNNYEAIEKNSAVVKQNCLRLIRTINNFIDTNKISEGYLKPNYGIYNIVDLVEDAAQASVRYIKKMKMTLVFDSQEEEIYIRCDGEFVQRAILNLLSNSVKYGRADGYVFVNIYVSEGKLFISVKNDGPAISPDIKPYLFDKFTKINKSLNRDKEGSGLGLYLCRSLIHLQKGELLLLTEKEFGNEFLITFPYEYIEGGSCTFNSLEINDLMEKVDIEFSDIYI